MKTVILFCGLPGSGKTTLALDLIETYGTRTRNDMVICSADDHFLDSEGKYNFNPAELGLAHAECFFKFVKSLQNPDIDVVILDNTNTSLIELSPYVLATHAFTPVDPKIFYIMTPPAMAFPRNTHGVPEIAFSYMWERILTSRVSYPPFWPKAEEIFDIGLEKMKLAVHTILER